MFVSVIVPQRVYIDNAGGYYELPVLHTEAGYLDGLIDYCIENYKKSKTWMRKLVRAAQLFLEYMHANPNECNSEVLFQNFASRLQIGTFDTQTGHDPSRLGWVPRTPADVQQIITNLSDYFDWVSKDKPNAALINRRIPVSGYDKALLESANIYRRKHALLGHLWKPPAEAGVTRRRVSGKRQPKVIPTEPPAFPEDRFEELLERGFTVGGRTNHRDQAITLLMHGAGFRVSEPMHLFIGDVTRDPINHLRAMVLIHHPTLGNAPADFLNERGTPVRCNRATYLQMKYGLAPRNDLMSKKEAGWKGVVLDDKYFIRPYWFKPAYAEMFMDIWNKYMEEVADIPLRLRNHPYAFMNIYREPKGSIYTLDKFIASHGRACERIGLIVEKKLGTTAHGHRHAYGRRLSAAEFTPDLIKKFMHHSNEKSQEVYTGLSVQETLVALETAFERMQSRS